MDKSRQSFSIDCWQCQATAEGNLYTLGICGGEKLLLRGIVAYRSQPLLHGLIRLYDNAERFKVETVIQRPEGVSVRDAEVILETIFRDIGEGGEYTDDWIWRPIELDHFLAHVLGQRRAVLIAAALEKALKFKAAGKNPTRIKEWL